MNMRVAKEEIALLMPTTLSHYADEPRFQAETAGRSLFARIASAITWISEIPARHAVLMELNEMSDRELADIGLQRADLVRVFDKSFNPHQGVAGLAGE